MNLTPEQKRLGEDNFHDAVASVPGRRTFLKAAAASAAGVGTAYFGYQQLEGKDRVKVGFIGTGDEGNILITEHPEKYMDIMAIADLRPNNRRRAFEGDGNSARVGLNKKLNGEQRQNINAYSTYQEMLKNEPDIQAVVIAVPLSQHFRIAKDCLEAGKHVLSEKLMCWSIGQCKELIKIAYDKKLLLVVGHQRHYSALYENCNALVQQKVLGDIKYIRAQWHRNTSFDGRDSWNKRIDKRDINDKELQKLLVKEGYKNLEELCHWRLYNKTGGGLMAELGSHQLDACSIFLGKVKPIAVQGYGGRNYFGVKNIGTENQRKDTREVDDHVYVTIEFPGPHYNDDPKDIVIVTYSSINTNGQEPYGETIFGSRGTMIVEQESKSYLFKESGPGSPGGVEQRLKLVSGGNKNTSVMNASESLGPSTKAAITQAGLGEKISRGYTEEMEHFCYAVHNAKEFFIGKSPDHGGQKSPKDGENGLRCNGVIAMQDAIMALTANLAMKAQRRIVFKPEWFDWTKPETPETDPEIIQWIKEAGNG